MNEEKLNSLIVTVAEVSRDISYIKEQIQNGSVAPSTLARANLIRVEDHEQRIRGLEKAKLIVYGFFLAVGSVLSVISVKIFN